MMTDKEVPRRFLETEDKYAARVRIYYSGIRRAAEYSKMWAEHKKYINDRKPGAYKFSSRKKWCDR